MPSTISYLHNLPTELRVDILRWTLRLTPLIRMQWMDMSLALQLIDSKSPRPSRGLPLWLLTCRTFLVEGLRELHRLFSSTIGPCVVSVPRSEYPTSIIDPCLMTSLTIATGALTISEKPWPDHGAAFVSSKVGEETLARVFDLALKGSHQAKSKIRTLRIRTGFINICTYCQKCDFPLRGPEEWDLGLTDLLTDNSKLEVLEFAITEIDTKADANGLIHTTNCWDGPQKAFAKFPWAGSWVIQESAGGCATQLSAGPMGLTAVSRFGRRGTQTDVKGMRSISGERKMNSI